MKVTVIQSRTFSPIYQKDVLTELAFPMRDTKQAEEMFKEEYPTHENLISYEFDDKERPDLYMAFSNAGCVRFF